MPVPNFVRRLLLLIFGKYDFWRIYSVETAQCREPELRFEIVPIEDLAIFDTPGLEPELQRANWSCPGALGYAAWRGNDLAGVCWLWPGPLLNERNIGLQPNDCAELIQITVASRFRGVGLASALIMYTACRLRDLGYRRLYAQVWRTNVPSMKAFDKAGWDQVAWFLQASPRLLSHPLRLRKIRRKFRHQGRLLENWRTTASSQAIDAAAPLFKIDWQAGPQSLKFTFGDVTAGQFHFRALISETPITSFEGVPVPPLPPAESLQPFLAGAVIRNFPVSTELRTFQFQGPWLRYVPIRYSRFLVRRTGTFEGYLTKFSSKSRKNLRRSVNRVASAAGSSDSWREYQTLAGVEEFHRFAADVSQKTYQAQLCHEGIEAGEEARKSLDALAANGLFRGYVLFVNGQPAAFALCEAKGRVLLYKTVGYAPEYREYSPGTVLLWHILERLFSEDSFDFLDFGEGEGFYKEYFANLSLRCARVYYFRRRPTTLAFVLAHRIWNLALSTANRTPGATTLIKKIRRSLRGQVVERPQDSPETT